jgi:hypothetical protein
LACRQQFPKVVNLPLQQFFSVMKQQVPKTLILEKVGDSRTAHLQPLIDFLKAHGNQPARVDDFTFDRDGYGDYRFASPLDMAALVAHFDFPPTLLLNQNSVEDTRNFVGINQHVAQGPPITLDF